MTTDKKLIARVTALVQRFLELIEIIRHDIRTRTAPNSERLQGDDKARVVELAKEGMLQEQILIDTINSMTSIFDDGKLILSGGTPMELRTTLAENIGIVSADITRIATDGRGAWLALLAEGGTLLSLDGAYTFTNKLNIEDLCWDVVSLGDNFYLLSANGSLITVNSDGWTISSKFDTKLYGVRRLIAYDDTTVLCYGMDGCLLYDVVDNVLSQVTLEGFDLMETFIDKRAMVVNSDSTVLITSKPIDDPGFLVSPVGRLNGKVVDTAIDNGGYFIALHENTLSLYKIANGTWSTHRIETDTPLDSVYADHRGIILCSGQDELWRSIDRGETWTQVLTRTTDKINGVFGGIRPEGGSVIGVVGDTKYVAVSG